VVSSKRDIENREDIITLVDIFYKDMINDATLGHFFKEHMSVELEKHLPIIYNFWESVLLGQSNYRGNLMLTHIALNKRSPLTTAHFEHWILLWESTIDNHFRGEISLMAKTKARTMKDLMLYKIDQSNNSNFIQ